MTVNKTVKIITAIFVLFFNSSCYDCNTTSKAFRDDECVIIVERIPLMNENFFNYEGRHPATNKKCNCRSETSYRWWTLYIDKIDIGDTIVKKKGELVFNIHKKDTIYSFPWECDGKFYK